MRGVAIRPADVWWAMPSYISVCSHHMVLVQKGEVRIADYLVRENQVRIKHPCQLCSARTNQKADAVLQRLVEPLALVGVYPFNELELR